MVISNLNTACMVHFYKEVTPEELYTIIVNHLEDFDRFNKEIIAFIKEYEKRRKS